MVSNPGFMVNHRIYNGFFPIVTVPLQNCKALCAHVEQFFFVVVVFVFV